MKLLPALSLTLLAVACSSPSGKELAPVTDVSGLERTDRGRGDLWLRPDHQDLSAFEGFLVRPVAVDHQDESIRNMARADADRMGSYLFKVVRAELSNSGYALATAPGPRVLSVELTVRGIESRKKEGDPISSFLLDVPVDVSSATIEAVFRDSVSERLEGVALSRMEGPADVITTWDEVNTAFDRWAVLFRQAVDQAHGR